MKTVISFFINTYRWIINTLRIFILYLMISLSNIEIQVFSSFGGKTKMGGGVITKMLFRSTLLEKLFQGKHDEKYVRQFYEILKKADAFTKKSNPHKMGVSADTYAKTLGKKDKFGRRYDHFGFFDEKHKYYGKTLEEVFKIELEERKTKDDGYKLIHIVNNKPIDAGLSKITDVVSEFVDEKGEIKYIVNDIQQKSKQHTFPIQIVRENKKCINKIEQLTDFLHIKLITHNLRRFEFFIPLKYKTHEFADDSAVIKDILNTKEIYIRDEYNELTGYSVTKFVKRFKHNNMYEVFRFDGFEMEKIEM